MNASFCLETEGGGATVGHPATLRHPNPQLLPETACRHYHYVLRIKVVAEGAVIKVDFVEGLGGESDHLTLVEAPILVLANDLLAGGDAQQGPLSTLQERASVTHGLHRQV